MREHSIASPVSFSFLPMPDRLNIDPEFRQSPMWRDAPAAPAVASLHMNQEEGRSLWHWLVVRCPYCGGSHEHRAYNGALQTTDPRAFLGGRKAHCRRADDNWHLSVEYKLVGIEWNHSTGAQQWDDLERYFPIVTLPDGFDAITPHGRQTVRVRCVNEGRIEIIDPLDRGSNAGNRQPIPRELRASIWAKSQGRCYFCGVQTNPYDTFAIDHLVPVADGGTNDPKNLVPSCKACNGAKGAMSLTSFRMKRGGGLFWFEIAMVGGSGMQP